MSDNEMLKLADQIEESEGIALMRPIGPIQIGIRKTAVVIAALRAALAKAKGGSR